MVNCKFASAHRADFTFISPIISITYTFTYYTFTEVCMEHIAFIPKQPCVVRTYVRYTAHIDLHLGHCSKHMIAPKLDPSAATQGGKRKRGLQGERLYTANNWERRQSSHFGWQRNRTSQHAKCESHPAVSRHAMEIFYTCIIHRERDAVLKEGDSKELEQLSCKAGISRYFRYLLFMRLVSFFASASVTSPVRDAMLIINLQVFVE